MTTRGKPPAPARPKLGTLPQRIGLADLSIAKTTMPRTDASWRGSKQSSSERGYGWKWQQARKIFLQANPLCVICEQEGRVVVATVVDHKIPHRGDQKLFWRQSNWRAICKPHHDSDAQKKDHEFDKAGNGR